jgi:carboxylesterase
MMSPVSDDRDHSPVFIPAKGPAALCLHGFTGTPYELRPLAGALADAGFAVSVPLLAGHGDSVAHLATTGWRDWLASAEAAFDRIREASDGGPVAVVGASMGGLLALRLARTRSNDVAALALFSVPLRLPAWQSVVLRAFARLPGCVRRRRFAALAKRGGSDVTDERIRRESPSLPAMPLAGLAELVALSDLVRRELRCVTAPAFVAHGERDRTVPRSASFELAGSLASSQVERLWLPRSGHLIAVDVEHAELCAAVTRFLATHTPRAPRPS